MDIIIGNIVAAAGSASLFFSTIPKSKNGILKMQAAGNFFLLVSDLILKGYSGAIQEVVSLLRNIIILAGKNGRVISIIMIAAGIIPGVIFNNNGLWGMLPIFANFEFACITLYPKSSETLLKVAIVISTMCWAVYCFVIKNYVSTFVNIVTAISALVFIIKNLRGGGDNGEVKEQ